MDKKKRSELLFVTDGAFGVEITTRYLDLRYAVLVTSTEVKATASGDLRLCSISPQPEHNDLPSFSARWDHSGNTVDIDLIRKGRCEKEFQGHHTVVASPGIYDCDIHVPEGHIFTGSIRLGTELALRLADSL
jgi:hypothetical protein